MFLHRRWIRRWIRGWIRAVSSTQCGSPYFTRYGQYIYSPNRCQVTGLGRGIVVSKNLEQRMASYAGRNANWNFWTELAVDIRGTHFPGRRSLYKVFAIRREFLVLRSQWRIVECGCSG